MSITIKAKVAPHTLKVNELPKHTHGMIGYKYEEENSSYVMLTMNSSNLLTTWYKDGVFYDQNILSSSTADGTKRYRAWKIGSSSSPTGEKGNNERLRKY